MTGRILVNAIDIRRAGPSRARRCQPDSCYAHPGSLFASCIPLPIRLTHRTGHAHRTHAASSNGSSLKQDDSDDQRPPGTLLSVLVSLRNAAAKRLSATVQNGPAWILQVLRCTAYAIGIMFISREYLAIQNRRAPQEVHYSDFMSLVDTKQVRSARLEVATSRIHFDVQPDTTTQSSTPTSTPTSTPSPATAAPSRLTTTTTTTTPAAAAAGVAGSAAVLTAKSKPKVLRPFFVKLAEKSDPLVMAALVKAGVDFGVVKAGLASSISNAFMTALSLWLPLLPLFFIMKRVIDSRTGTSRTAKKAKTSYQKVTFADVAGVEGAKEELLEVVECLKNSAQYSKLRAKMPSGVLLCGPPGTGKTLLARAVAGEAGVPFMSVSASEFVELFVGRGAARIRELFAEARKSAPCVIFIDELDAVGASRGRGWNEERDQTLNQLLTELDGFEGRPGVLLLAATNRPEVLDAALLRPGRISRKVLVPVPDEIGRAAILGVHLRSVPLVEGLSLAEAAERVAAVTNGLSGAELANVVNEAALLAARGRSEAVGLRDLLDGVRRTRFGVNGRTASRDDAGSRFQDWLMGLAAQPTKVPTAPM